MYVNSLLEMRRSSFLYLILLTRDKSISDFYGAYKNEHVQRIACVNNKCLNAIYNEIQLL